jgi:predicted ATPase
LRSATRQSFALRRANTSASKDRSWGGKTYYSQLHLAPLDTEEAEELLTFLLGSDASLQALKPLILDKTEGTPFFMEEVVQTLAEDGGHSGERGIIA